MHENNDEKQNFSSPDSWKNAGNEYFKKGDFNSAIKCYASAIELDPNYVDAWNNLGFTLLKIGKIEEAKKCDEKVKEIKSTKSSENHFNLNITSKDDPDTLKKKYENGEISYTEYQKTCGEIPSSKTNENIRDPGTAGLLSFFFNGSGQVYNGQVGKGILYPILTLIGLFLLILPGVIVWIYQIYDSISVAKKINSGVLPYQKATKAGIIAYIFTLIMIVLFFSASIAAFQYGLMGNTNTIQDSKYSDTPYTPLNSPLNSPEKCSYPNTLCNGICYLPCQEGNYLDSNCHCIPEGTFPCGDGACSSGAWCCKGKCYTPCPKGYFASMDCACYEEGGVIWEPAK